VVGLGVVLLGVAAWSVARARVGGSSPQITSDVPGGASSLSDALLVVMGALAAAILLFLAPLARRRRRPRPDGNEDEAPRPPWWWRIVGGLLLLFAVVVPVMLSSRAKPTEVKPPPAQGEPEPVERERQVKGTGAHGWGAAGLVAIGALGVAAATLAVQRRGRGRGHALDDAPWFGASDEVPDFDQLEPATAVRAAYATARRRLASIGLPSRPPEAPFEYLERVRRQQPDVAGAAASLTHLFEIARYSQHPVTVQMKRAAVDAYRAIEAHVERVTEPTVVAAVHADAPEV
jgi:hypothetical protein